MPIEPLRRGRATAIAGLLLAVLIWGTTFVATKVALREVPPMTLTLGRFLFATVALWPLAWAERRRAVAKLPWQGLLAAGLIGGCLYYGLQNLGMVYTTASEASLILAAVPALTAALSALVLRERIGAARAVGVALSVAGVAAIIAADPAATWQSGGIAGDLLIVASALAWAGYTMLGKGMQAWVTPAVLSAATVGLGAALLLPLVGYEAARQPLRAPSAAAWLAIAYLGLVASTLPFLLWNRALRHLDASEAAVYTNLVPLVAVVSAVALLGETPAPLQLVGGALAVAGVCAAGVNVPRGAGRRR